MHEVADNLYDYFDYKVNRNLSEVFVESIDYIVANPFGLDTSHCSFNYIIKWVHRDTKTVLDLGAKIQECANKFIENFNVTYTLNKAA